MENRIPPPIVLLFFLSLMWFLAKIGTPLSIDAQLRVVVSSLLALSGLFCMIAGVMSFRKAKTTVNPLKPKNASELVVVGIYRFSRNPMYLGMACIALAWAVFLAKAITIVGALGFIIFIHRFQIIPEERAMQELFGDQYTRYKNSVRPWI